ncbi:MAG: hypothetical protein OEV85_08000 [Candidatus Thorarchaeota archaeon]|nr:hypothetical protein [Candidatus Thorarchaeota archaeon]
MFSSPDPIGIIKELERAEHVLDVLLRQLTSIYTNLEPLERDLRVDDFSSSGMFVPGLATGIVCALTADIKGDPIYKALESIKGRGLKLPAIIKGADRTEAPVICDSIMKIIRAQFNLKTTRFIVNLRWSSLPSIIDNDNVMILGTRYFHGDRKVIEGFKNRLKGLNLEVLEDNGEFGGGLLTYKLTNFAKEIDSITVLELTLSSALCENITKVAKIFEAITIP